MLADAGFSVTGLDIKQDRIDKINAGANPIEGKEPGLAEILSRVVQNGKLTAATDYDALSDVDIVLIDVETPVSYTHLLVMEVLDSGMLVQGPRVETLEKMFAELCEVKHAIATTSGTTALHIALLANGIGEGDEVITTPFTFIASANSILYAGATPVFVDIDEETFNIDPNLIEAAITPKTKAILPVHLYGYVCNMDAIMDIARRHNLVMIEDACQAVDASFKGKKAGSFGTGVFSLYATKNVMSGEGGMITTDDDDIADSVSYTHLSLHEKDN